MAAVTAQEEVGLRVYAKISTRLVSYVTFGMC